MPKPLVTFIEFLAPFPRLRNESDDTAGYDLVRRISRQLTGAGISVYPIEHRRVWNWKIRARTGLLNVSTLVGVVDAFIPGPVNKWNAMHHSHLRLPWKFVQNSVLRNRHIEDHERYCKSFCEIIDSIGELGNVIWYNTTSMGIRDAGVAGD